MEKSKPNQIINNKIGSIYGVTDETYKSWCKENKLKITDKSNRDRYIKEVIERGNK